MGSVRQIAKIVGVSPATVSRAMNNHPRVAADVRRKVLAAVNRSRYVPKDSARATTYIAIGYTGEASLGSPFDSTLLRGISERMGESGLDLVILELARARLPGESYAQMFLRKRVRGVILRTDVRTRHVCHEIAAEGVPSLVVADRFDDPKISFLDTDSRSASVEAVEHLIALGHRKIAMALNVVDDSDHIDRLEAYREALKAHGIDVDEKLILRVPANREGGRQVLRRIRLMSQRPTALFLADPAMVVGVTREAGELGLEIPRELSIVGFDDADMRYDFYPQLTAVCQNGLAMGREAFDALHAILEKSSATPVIQKTMRSWLEVHDSTMPPESSQPADSKQKHPRSSARADDAGDA